MSKMITTTTTTITEFTPESFSVLLKLLVNSPNEFNLIHLIQSFNHLIKENATNSSQIGSFLTALKMSGKDSNPEVVATCAKIMRNHSISINLTEEDENSSSNCSNRGPICDIVGTGGDGHNTFNVSTTAGIVAAGAGCRVFKHGNKAATSSSGSADILLSLGCPITSLSPSSIASIAQQSPFLFLYAPSYHPAMARIAPIRKTLGFPTVFNALGPLINPARPEAMVVGVHSKNLGPIFAEALNILKVKGAWVVCGCEGLDEISPAGETNIWEVKNGVVTPRTISPANFGLTLHPLTSVVGGTPLENAETLRRLLRGEIDSEDPIENFVVMNAAALLLVAGIAKDEVDGVRLARESIHSGKAAEALEKFRLASTKFAVSQ